MEMEKSFYVVTYRPAYAEMLRSKSAAQDVDTDGLAAQRVVLGITQGGFGQDVVDDERQVKERFLEYLFFSSDIDLPRSPEVFDQYFDLQQADEFVDLDEEM